MAEATADEVAAVAAVVGFFLPPPARKPIAEKLCEFGVRVHPELATKELVAHGPADLGNWRPQYVQKIDRDVADPVNKERVAHVRAITQVLSAILRRPGPAPIADKLYGLGARFHPELATNELAAEIPSNRQDGMPVAGVSTRDPMDIVRHFAPALAEQMAKVTTEDERLALVEQIRFEYGSQIAALADQIAQLKPEDLEPRQ
jgi:hypothetical protein